MGAGCEVTKGADWSCNLPHVSGECCTMMQASAAGQKGESIKVAMKLMKEGTLDQCGAASQGDMPNCPPPPAGEELPDFLAMVASATANLAAAGCEVTKGADWSCNLPHVSGECCTMMQASAAGQKGESIKVAMKLMKEG